MSYFPPAATNVDNVGGAANSSFPAHTIPRDQIVNLGLVYISLVGSASSNVVSILQKESGTTQGAYQVTTGKTFYCLGYYTTATASGAHTKFTWAQSTAAPTQGGSVASAPAGSVFFNAAGDIAGGSADAVTGSGIAVSTTGAAEGIFWVPTPGLKFSATYYPYFVPDGTLAFSIRLIGYEQ